MSVDSEQQIAQAVAFLREKMPENFILMAVVNEEVVTMGGFSLNSAREMLDTAIKAISEQYAYNAAKKAVKP